MKKTANKRLTLASAALVGLTAPATLGQGQPLEAGPFEIDDADPVGSVPTPEQAIERPLEMGYHVIELTERADAASQRGEYDRAARYYLALAKAAPDRAIGFSKACEEFEKAEMWSEASDACRGALGREGVGGEDYQRFVVTTLRKAELLPSDVHDLDAVLSEMKARLTTPPGPHRVTTLECQLAVRVEEPARLESCAESVRTWPEGDPERLALLTVEALARDDFDAARAAADEARAAGAPAELVERATGQIAAREDAHDHAHGLWARFGWPAVVGLLGLVGGALTFTSRRRSPAAA